MDIEKNNKRTGIGVDIIETARFVGKSLDRDGVFLEKIFTKKELKYCFSKDNCAERLAARFAAKEAITKALHSLTPLNKRTAIALTDIEIGNDSDGAPEATILRGLDDVLVQISISHVKEYAIAFAIAGTLS